MNASDDPTRSARWLPHPRTSLALLVFWLWLNSSVSAGHIVLGALAGLVIPWFTAVFWPERVRIARPATIAMFAIRVLGDIAVANLIVAVRILGPNSALKPSFVVVPVQLGNDFALATLAAVISLTPGTVSANLSADRRRLLVHALNNDDDDELVATIKNRYERPLEEIFRC